MINVTSSYPRRPTAISGGINQVKRLCEPHYASGVGRPGISPGVYFRMLLVGYFEGIACQRGIAWRCADSLSLREFLGLAATESSPDHSSLTKVRQRLPLEMHVEVFHLVLEIAAEKKLLQGKCVAVDATGARVGSQRGHEEHCQTRHQRRLETVLEAFDAGRRLARRGR